MRAIFIDARLRQVHEIVLPDNDDSDAFLQAMYRAINCKLVQMVRVGDHDLFVDEEGLINGIDYGFVWAGDRRNPLCGNGIILAYGGDRSKDATWSVDVVRRQVEFWRA